MPLSIIIAIHNGLEYTSQCVETIKNCTAGEYELIIVDNGSKDGSQDYFSSADCVYIRNEENLGCAKAWNQGIKASKHDWICILNNDTLLPPGWDSYLQKVAEQHNLAVVAPAFYEGPMDYSLECASRMHAELFGDSIIKNAWNAICLVTRREVIERVGLFDEGYRLGKYEDIDFIRRVGKAKLGIGLACGVLIHHYGSKTVIAVKAEVGQDFEIENHRRFLKSFKYGRAERVLMRFREKIIHKRESVFRRESTEIVQKCLQK